MGIVNWIIENWIQVVGVLTGAGAVFFLARNNGPVGWTLGVINAVFFIVLFTTEKLYGDVLLNSYYFITSAVGLYYWKFGGRNKTERKISHLDVKGYALSIGAALAAMLSIGYLFDNYTDAHYAYTDMFIVGMSFVGQFLLAKKIFENWYFWIVADIVAIYLYTAKDLYLVTAMTAVYLVFCVMGVFKWRKVETEEKAQELAENYAAKMNEPLTDYQMAEVIAFHEKRQANV